MSTPGCRARRPRLEPLDRGQAEARCRAHSYAARSSSPRMSAAMLLRHVTASDKLYDRWSVGPHHARPQDAADGPQGVGRRPRALRRIKGLSRSDPPCRYRGRLGPAVGRRAAARRRAALAAGRCARHERARRPHRPAAAARQGRRRRGPAHHRHASRGRREMDPQEHPVGAVVGRCDLCRAGRRQAGPVSPAAGAGDLGRHRGHGPLHGPCLLHGGRLLVRPVGVQPRHPGAAPAGLILQALRLRGRDRQRLHAFLHRHGRSDRDRSGPGPRHLAAGQRRRRGFRPPYAALRHRAFAQPDDGAARQGHRHAADRRICQALRHLRRHAAGARHVARRRRDHGAGAW